MAAISTAQTGETVGEDAAVEEGFEGLDDVAGELGTELAKGRQVLAHQAMEERRGNQGSPGASRRVPDRVGSCLRGLAPDFRGLSRPGRGRSSERAAAQRPRAGEAGRLPLRPPSATKRPCAPWSPAPPASSAEPSPAASSTTAT